MLLTGEHDYNREQIKAVAERYKKDGFKHVTYIEVPGMDHRMPDAQWFEKGILALDAPLGRIPKDVYPVTGAMTNDVGKTVRVEGEHSSSSALTPGVEVRLEAPKAKTTFLAYVPADYTPKRSWPIIFCYHGYGAKMSTAPFKSVTGGIGFIIVGMPYTRLTYEN